MKQKNSKRATYWAEHIRRATAAPGGVRSYCDKNGVRRQAFYYWKKRLGGDEASRLVRTAFSRVEVVSPVAASAPMERMPPPKWLAEFLVELARAGSGR